MARKPAAAKVPLLDFEIEAVFDTPIREMHLDYLVLGMDVLARRLTDGHSMIAREVAEKVGKGEPVAVHTVILGTDEAWAVVSPFGESTVPKVRHAYSHVEVLYGKHKNLNPKLHARIMADEPLLPELMNDRFRRLIQRYQVLRGSMLTRTRYLTAMSVKEGVIHCDYEDYIPEYRLVDVMFAKPVPVQALDIFSKTVCRQLRDVPARVHDDEWSSNPRVTTVRYADGVLYEPGPGPGGDSRDQRLWHHMEGHSHMKKSLFDVTVQINDRTSVVDLADMLDSIFHRILKWVPDNYELCSVRMTGTGIKFKTRLPDVVPAS